MRISVAVLCFVALQLQLGYGELKHTMSLLLHVESVQHLAYPAACTDRVVAAARVAAMHCCSTDSICSNCIAVYILILLLLLLQCFLNRYSTIIIFFHSSASELAVTIDVSYSKPADFSMDPPNYCAGSSITLTCRVEGVTDGLTYSWSSTCTHNCFVRGKTTQNVTRHGLHSVDSGTHMCNVTDALGRRGTATIVMNVTGKAGYAGLVTKK